MSMKKLFTVSAIGLAMGIMSATATAEGDGFVEDYVTNSSGEVWKNSYGECWRDRFAATDEKKAECGYEGIRAVMVGNDIKAVVIGEPKACPDVLVLKDLHFEFDSTSISDVDKDKLASARDFVLAAVPEGCHKTETIHVTGHTDSTGPEAYNDKLSMRRAEAVISYLRSIGGKANMEAKGKGELEPVADNSTKQGRADNRRVVIDINTAN